MHHAVPVPVREATVARNDVNATRKELTLNQTYFPKQIIYTFRAWQVVISG